MRAFGESCFMISVVYRASVSARVGGKKTGVSANRNGMSPTRRSSAARYRAKSCSPEARLNALRSLGSTEPKATPRAASDVLLPRRGPVSRHRHRHRRHRPPSVAPSPSVDVDDGEVELEWRARIAAQASRRVRESRSQCRFPTVRCVAHVGSDTRVACVAFVTA